MSQILEQFLTHINDSEHLDKILGYEVTKVERELIERAFQQRPHGDLSNWGMALHDGNQTWVGLAPETLQTPYADIKRICDLLSPSPGERVVDLGAGYGRMGPVLKLFYPEVHFLGFEYVKERVEAGSKVLSEIECTKAKLIEQDLTDSEFELPEADYYFIYDYGQLQHIRQTLNQLDRMADKKTFKVIARGMGTRSIIENEYPWLSQVHAPHHEKSFSIYFMSF